MKLEKLQETAHWNEMCEIAKKYGTDKHQHGYTKLYYEVMKDKRYEDISIFEIGIYMGNSIKLWHEFFQKGRIYGIDNGRIVPNTSIEPGYSNENPSVDDSRLQVEGEVVVNYNFNWLENNRIKCAVADQRSIEQIAKAFEYFGCNQFDFIIDDGQHYQEHQQKSLAMMFKNVKSGGFYIIEDVVNYEDMLTGSFWGQKRKDFTDATDLVFMNFLETGILKSDYMTEDEIKYITDNIDDIFMYDQSGRSNSPVNGTSKLLIIKKK